MPDPLGSREDLLQHLERISGRTIRTRGDIEAYVAELKAAPAAGPPSHFARRWQMLKHASLGVGLLIALLQYYLIEVYVEILSLQRVQFFTPGAGPALRRSALHLLHLVC